jgi:hypothetical protein
MNEIKASRRKINVLLFPTLTTFIIPAARHKVPVTIQMISIIRRNLLFIF